MGKYDEMEIDKNKEGMRTGLDFINNRLIEEGMDKKNIPHILLASEECLVTLFAHSKAGSTCIIQLRHHLMGGFEVELEMPGVSFDVEEVFGDDDKVYDDLEYSLELDDLGLEDLDTDMESSIRNVILNGFEDRIHYRHSNGVNSIIIDA